MWKSLALYSSAPIQVMNLLENGLNHSKKTIGEDIKTVQFGWPLGIPLVDNLGRGLWEVCPKLRSRRIARILFFMDDNIMILVHRFIKKTQQTPKQALDLALKRKRLCEVDMANKYKDSTFDSFLEEEALLDKTEAVAIKRLVAYKLEELMKRERLNKKTLASKMQTSRSALDRLLDPENTSITLRSLVRAAGALGKKLEISLVN